MYCSVLNNGCLLTLASHPVTIKAFVVLDMFLLSGSNQQMCLAGKLQELQPFWLTQGFYSGH